MNMEKQTYNNMMEELDSKIARASDQLEALDNESQRWAEVYGRMHGLSQAKTTVQMYFANETDLDVEEPDVSTTR